LVVWGSSTDLSVMFETLMDDLLVLASHKRGYRESSLSSL
jgi:hypothetical protein